MVNDLVSALLLAVLLALFLWRAFRRGKASEPKSSASYIVLRKVNDADGSRLLEASLTSGGDVLIEGLDHGDGVERIFGEREYEWKWTIPASGVPALLRALDATGNVLAALGERFSGEDAAGLSEFLESHAIPHDRWSRTGD